MIVRKLKCASCGSSKVAEVKSGYVFCDYCAAFMGFDFVKMEDESKQLFDMNYYLENGGWPQSTQEYLSVVTQLGEVIEQRDSEKYIELAMKQMELQVSLLPGTFSPKMKVEGYRKKFLTYYHAFLKDQIEDGFFENQKKIQEMLRVLSQNINMEMIDGNYIWRYDEHAKEYFKTVYEYSVSLSEKVISYPSVRLYPDEISENSKDLFLKQSMAGYCKMLSESDFILLAKEYGFENYYIEIPDLETDDVQCSCCNSTITALKGAKLVVCETCGNKVEPNTRMIHCQNCGSTFTPTNGSDSRCEYCGSRVQLC